jgi:hypothetical protein
MADPASPFEIASAVPEGTPSYFSALVPVVRAMAMDRHDQLKDAWRALYEETDPARRAEMQMLFDALPFTPDELQAAVENWRVDSAARSRDRLAWGTFFAEQYQKVIVLGARDDGS